MSQQYEFQFLHPFCCIISGPSFSGKTFLVKNLLHNCVSIINTPPEKIIWLYKHWQPLYDEISEKVIPKVEFIRGVPQNLEDDDFVDITARNLIILDDLMYTCSKDQKINSLFTEGAHHRNLSVIAINQNLYYNKDTTQRRNCHYLILFKNPMDKGQIMTLARQMYPENPKTLMHHYDDATSKPYGHLLIDLKASTPDSNKAHGS